MITVHIIFNAHIDPIWVWPWQSGLDEALATCRSACDRLDAHPDIFFSRGEAWVYSQVEKVDPKLFGRIKAHVAAGRWEIVNGWWIQPDCNAPSGFAMERQISLGKAYFKEKFGQFPRVGYNVDSFGHAATLPGYLQAAGQDRYVMMRPQQHEKPLPARVFRWQGYEGGPEVTTFRIADTYGGNESEWIIDRAIERLPEKCEHTMIFMGVGDHGGGPTERMISWLRERMQSRKDVRLQFSTVSKFFDAIEPIKHTLPLVTGELQMHAVGCYSVTRSVKTALRKAEHQMFQAEQATIDLPGFQLDDRAREAAWKYVVFHHFHDTLGGTCLPSAYPQILNQLGSAGAFADEALQYSLRHRMSELPNDAMQRMVFFNPSDTAWDDYVEVEPWLGWQRWQSDFRLIDEKGSVIPSQVMESEALMGNPPTRLLFRLQAPARSLRVVRIERAGGVAISNSVRCGMDRVENDLGFAFDGEAAIVPILAPLNCRLDLIVDQTDTWSHGVDRFSEGPAQSPRYDASTLASTGPLMAALARVGKVSDSIIEEEWRVYSGCAMVDLRLRIHWREQFKLLKLTVPLHALDNPQTRIDGIMGGQIERPNEGHERPLRDFVLIAGANTKLGIVCPDVYAVDVTPLRARFTLLRSPMMSWHDPYRGTTPRATFSDQGVHEFRFRFFAAPTLTTQLLNDHAMMLQRPLTCGDLTRGMGDWRH